MLMIEAWSIWFEFCASKTIMMTSSNGNIFRVTGPLCGEFTGPGEFPTQMPVTRSFDVCFDLRLNKRLSKQPWGWWFEAPSWSLWRHRNAHHHRSPSAPGTKIIHMACVQLTGNNRWVGWICRQDKVNSLAPGRFEQNFREVIFKLISVSDGCGISCKIALRWMPLDLTDDKSILVQIMAWCHQATSQYLNQCWPTFMSPYGVTRPKRVKAYSIHQNTYFWRIYMIKKQVLVSHNCFQQDKHNGVT